jgi:hypothetical protein
MNYYQARQRKISKRWDYTVMNDGHIRPLGYCIPWDRLERAFKDAPFDADADLRHLAEFKDEYHDDGHETEEEAEECYKNYLLDHRLKFMEVGPAEGYTRLPEFPCLECAAPTAVICEVDGRRVGALCGDHQTKDVVSKHFKAPKQTISSY